MISNSEYQVKAETLHVNAINHILLCKEMFWSKGRLTVLIQKTDLKLEFLFPSIDNSFMVIIVELLVLLGNIVYWHALLIIFPNALLTLDF